MHDIIEEIFDIIRRERAYQDKKWGGKIKDSKKSVGDWLIDIGVQLNGAKLAYYSQLNKSTLQHLIKIAALAIACLEYNLSTKEHRNWREEE